MVCRTFQKKSGGFRLYKISRLYLHREFRFVPGAKTLYKFLSLLLFSFFLSVHMRKFSSANMFVSFKARQFFFCIRLISSSSLFATPNPSRPVMNSNRTYFVSSLRVCTVVCDFIAKCLWFQLLNLVSPIFIMKSYGIVYCYDYMVF